MADVPTTTQLTLIVSRRGTSVFEAPNLLEATLALGALPFSAPDWPIPTRGKAPAPHSIAVARPFFFDEGKPHHQDTWPTPLRLRTGTTFDPPALLQSTLTPPLVVMPFSQTDWPVVLKVERPTETIAYARPFFYNEGKPQHQDLWPTPLRLRAPITFEPQALLQSTLTPPLVVMPFSQTDWPVVLKVERPTDTIAYARPFFYDEGKPQHQDLWPTPLRLRVATTFEPQALLQGTLSPGAVTMPFAQSEWPVVFAVRQSTLTIAQARPAYYDEGKPVHQEDWMVPSRARGTATFEALNLLQGTLGPGGPTTPFVLLDWKIPPAWRHDPRTHTRSQNRPFFYEDAPPPVEAYLIVFSAEALQPPSRVYDEGLE